MASPTPRRCRYDAGSRPVPTVVVDRPICQEQRVIGLMQRVSEASVEVDGRRVAAIGRGLLVLVGVERGDGEAEVRRLLERLLGFRVFDDAGGRMNLDVRAAGGALLLVPQFTLAADTAKGNRPGFSKAADPERGRVLFDRLVEAARAGDVPVEAGVFGATMRVALCNEGPATFWLQVPPRG
jgi:D-tyrosyl-tRNA(Tyr) deacylase